MTDLPAGKAGSKITTYLLYAIGEIVLVVVGILIAVQIDDWNNQKVEQKEREKLVENLLIETNFNLKSVNRSIDQVDGAVEAGLMILTLIDEYKVPSDGRSDSIIYAHIATPDFRPSQGALTDIISSGKISLIRNDSLRAKLFSFSEQINHIQKLVDRTERSLLTMFYPYLIEHLSFANMDAQLNSFRTNEIQNWPAGRFSSDTKEMFNSRRFQSCVDDHIWRSLFLKEQYVDYRQDIKNTLRLLEQELNN